MTHREARGGAAVATGVSGRVLFGALFSIAPVLDVLAGGTAGLLHFVTTLSGIALLAAALTPRILLPAGSARYDPS